MARRWTGCQACPRCRKSTTPPSRPRRHGHAARVLQDWRPEDATFGANTGRDIARRNLWLSIPALLLWFSFRMVWSMVKIYVKSGIVTWETQQTDCLRTRADLPNHEPRSCARGA